jgi:hypothetical protein
MVFFDLRLGYPRLKCYDPTAYKQWWVQCSETIQEKSC